MTLKKSYDRQSEGANELPQEQCTDGRACGLPLHAPWGTVHCEECGKVLLEATQEDLDEWERQKNLPRLPVQMPDDCPF